MKRPKSRICTDYYAEYYCRFLASAYKFVVAKSNTAKEKPIKNAQKVSSTEAANSSDHHA